MKRSTWRTAGVAALIGFFAAGWLTASVQAQGERTARHRVPA